MGGGCADFAREDLHIYIKPVSAFFRFRVYFRLAGWFFGYLLSPARASPAPRVYTRVCDSQRRYFWLGVSVALQKQGWRKTGVEKSKSHFAVFGNLHFPTTSTSKSSIRSSTYPLYIHTLSTLPLNIASPSLIFISYTSFMHRIMGGRSKLASSNSIPMNFYHIHFLNILFLTSSFFRLVLFQIKIKIN